MKTLAILGVLLGASVVQGQTVTVSNMLDPDTGRASAWNGTHRLIRVGPSTLEAAAPQRTFWTYTWLGGFVQVTEPAFPPRIIVHHASGRWSIGITDLDSTGNQPVGLPIAYRTAILGVPVFRYSP